MMAGVSASPRPPPTATEGAGDAACADRRPGRPRSVEADRAILDATWTCWPRYGYARLTMEGVATDAGVGKATLYRRWSSKTELILDAIRSMKASVPHPDTGDTRSDLVTLMKRGGEPERRAPQRPDLGGPAGRGATRRRAGRAVPSAVPRCPAASRPRRCCAGRSLRGDLRPDTDFSLVLDQLMGSVFYRQLIVGQPLRNADVEALVDQVLAGVTRPALTRPPPASADPCR